MKQSLKWTWILCLEIINNVFSLIFGRNCFNRGNADFFTICVVRWYFIQQFGYLKVDVQIQNIFKQFCYTEIHTGNVSLGLPLFRAYIVRNAAKASSVRPCDIRNLGLSGKKLNAMPLIKLGVAHKARYICHGWTAIKYLRIAIFIIWYFSFYLQCIFDMENSQSFGSTNKANTGMDRDANENIIPIHIITLARYLLLWNSVRYVISTANGPPILLREREREN